MCPTWSQISVLLVNGAGHDAVEVEPVTEARQRCEICLEWFQTAAELVQHLQATHHLQGLSFNASRDSIDNSPACAHCGQLFMTVAGLKSHIVQGRCGYFNPQASAETQPVDELWRMACLDGKLLEILETPNASNAIDGDLPGLWQKLQTCCRPCIALTILSCQTLAPFEAAHNGFGVSILQSSVFLQPHSWCQTGQSHLLATAPVGHGFSSTWS